MAGLQSDLIDRAVKLARNRSSIYSFGDEGVTASVSASGRLLQMTRYFAGKKSGFCVDDPYFSDPYFVVARLEQLLSNGADRDSTVGIGPRLPSEDFHKSPCFSEFVHDRWPCFTMKVEGLVDVTIYYVVYKGIIYQTFEFRKWPKNGKPPELSIHLDLPIRQLDYIDIEASDPHTSQILHNERHLVRERILRAPEHGGTLQSSAEVGVALHIASFSGEKRLAFERQDGTDRYNVAWSSEEIDNLEKGELEITLAYMLRDGEEASSTPPFDIRNAKSLLKDDFEEQKFTEERHLNWILRRNLEHILSVCSIPVESVHFTPSSNGRSTVDVPTIALTCGDIDGHRVSGAASL